MIEMLSADFADVYIEMGAGNGRVLAYLAAHAEIYRQEFHDNSVAIHCYLPRHCCITSRNRTCTSRC